MNTSTTSPRLRAVDEWIDGAPAERYRPMRRLLDEADIDFLRRQPGFDASMAARLRAQRAHIFGCYLASLRDDFRQTCRALRVLMVNAEVDRPNLAAALMRKQAQFELCLWRARWRLLLYRWGAGCVDTGCLMRLFDSVCFELKEMAPVAGVTSLT